MKKIEIVRCYSRAKENFDDSMSRMLVGEDVSKSMLDEDKNEYYKYKEVMDSLPTTLADDAEIGDIDTLLTKIRAKKIVDEVKSATGMVLGWGIRKGAVGLAKMAGKAAEAATKAAEKIK